VTLRTGETERRQLRFLPPRVKAYRQQKLLGQIRVEKARPPATAGRQELGRWVGAVGTGVGRYSGPPGRGTGPSSAVAVAVAVLTRPRLEQLQQRGTDALPANLCFRGGRYE
jgi:hypothetical protein